MKILLINPPFCPPTMVPYAISYLKGFLGTNLHVDAKCLDLNAVFHRMRFPDLYGRLRSEEFVTDAVYGQLLAEFEAASRKVHSSNNKEVVCGRSPELIGELIKIVDDEKPDLVAFSVVYSSQSFYVSLIAKALMGRGVSCVAGGPALNYNIKEQMPCLNNERELAGYIVSINGSSLQKKEGSALISECLPDFSDYDRADYFSRELIVPIKTSSTCFYQQCTFCTHFAKVPYREYGMDQIMQSIRQSGARNVFFIDDMISKNRLLDIAGQVKEQKISWWVQLRPTKDLLGSFEILAASGCKAICWGVESGSQRILDLIKKGTLARHIPKILKQSDEAGIKNIIYIMFGFPSETRDEFLETIEFLKDNQANIFLVSPSVFGLQKGSRVWDDPQGFGIASIKATPRVFLGEKIEYTVSSGLDKEAARRLRGRFSKTIAKINKAHPVFKDYKEQVLLIGKENFLVPKWCNGKKLENGSIPKC